MTELLKRLLDYSRQPLQVGHPPHYIFAADGMPQDRELIQISAQLRIAEALEKLTQPTTAWEAVGPFGHKVALTLDPDLKTVHLSLECPDAESGRQALRALQTSLQPLFEQEGGQADG